MDPRHRNKLRRMSRQSGIELPSLSAARMRPELQAMAKSASVIRERAPQYVEIQARSSKPELDRGWFSRLWRGMRGK